MSKIKDALLMQEQKEFEIDLGYEEWLYDQNQELSESDINKMEEELENPSPSNNIHYHSNKGESL